VLYVSPQSQLNLSRGGGVVTGINWKQYDPAITDFEIVDDSSGLILFADSIGLVYNTEVIAPKDVPKTVEELQDPKWKGLVTTTPYGTGWGEWAFFVGPDKAFEVARGIAKNVGGTTGSTDFGPIISGQFPIMAWTGSTQKALMDKEKGAPIDIVRPDFVYFLSSVVVIDGTPHPNLAKLFILFLRTTEGQDILWKHNRQDSPYLMGRHIWAQIQDALDNPNVRIHLETQSSLKKWPGGGLDAYFGLRKKINKLMKQGG
jgi:iron(III) transport system substrate-binding protein